MTSCLLARHTWWRRLQCDAHPKPSGERPARAGRRRGPLLFPNAHRTPRLATNLFTPLTSFVGREEEAEALRRMLHVARLITLTGPGGVGKTRLAVHVAASLLDTFVDGVRLVELASLNDAARLPQAAAAQLGVSETPGQPDAEALTRALRGRHILVILDNCEHLVEACAQWVDAMLRTCPRLSIVATSREPLGIHGERLWPVRPLRVPSARLAHGGTPERILDPELVGGASVQLFVDRAAAVQPGFALTAENATAVVQICRQLDGLPLAIELAAGRVPILFPGGIAARLDDPFRLLTGGSRAALQRQQTLRATLDWSYTCSHRPSASCSDGPRSLRPGGLCRQRRLCAQLTICVRTRCWISCRDWWISHWSSRRSRPGKDDFVCSRPCDSTPPRS